MSPSEVSYTTYRSEDDQQIEQDFTCEEDNEVLPRVLQNRIEDARNVRMSPTPGFPGYEKDGSERKDVYNFPRGGEWGLYTNKNS
jgi:hypothetical protein